MALDLEKVGYKTKTYELAYDWKTLAAYSLGIGAQRSELQFLYENTDGGMKVYPTFAVVPAYEAVHKILLESGGDMSMLVHGGQTVRAHRRIPSEGRIETVGTLTAIYDMKRFAQAILDTQSTIDGEPVFDTTWSIIFRGEGGYGGKRPPPNPAPSVPKDRPADWRVEQTTSPEQALLYRLSGDANPLHADPAFAEKVGFPQGPILHGLCTYGFAGRAVVQQAASGNPEKLKRLSCQFSKPVWPGDTVITEGWDLGEGKVSLVTRVQGRPDPVLTRAWAEIG